VRYSGEKSLDIFISAGEASGDLHGSNLARAIWSIAPKTRLSCLGGSLMRNAGVPVVVDNRNISVVGASEVVSHIRAIWNSWCKIRSHIRSNPPEVVVLIDFPDFNFLLGKFAKKAGSKIFYYISPQVWAWRERRVYTIKRMVDRMAVILPFEKAFYGAYGMEVDYVGHPLVDVLSASPGIPKSRKTYGLNSSGPVIGLLPGSRNSEINLLLGLLMDSAQLIHESFPDARFIIPVASSLSCADIKTRVEKWNVPLEIVGNDTYGVIRSCDLILTASGTVTLEAAIIGTPMIITNRLSNLSAMIGRRLIRVKYAGLPNLIAGYEIVPEFIQDRAQALLIAEKAVAMLKFPESLEQQREAFKRIRGQLGEPGISDRVAGLVVQTARGG
jgi:lipid-A-disaccharide synthase